MTGGLTPGDALDLGCGEGADAIWLASQGWWHDDLVFPTAAEVLDALDVDLGRWVVERLGSRPRRATAPDGVEVDVTDSVVRLRRSPPAP